MYIFSHHNTRLRLPLNISQFRVKTAVYPTPPHKCIYAVNPRPTPRYCIVSVCVLCGSPVWPSSPVVGPLWGPPLCVGPLCWSPVWVPCVGPPCVGPLCVGPLCGSPVWVLCVGPSARRVASCGIYSRDVSRSFTRSRSDRTHHTVSTPFLLRLYEEKQVTHKHTTRTT